MKIYCLMGDGDGRDYVVGLFSDRDKAERVAERLGTGTHPLEIPLDDHDPDKWPSGQPFELIVTERPMGAALPRWIPLHFPHPSSEWYVASQPIDAGEWRCRRHARIAWCETWHDADNILNAKVAELQQLPFDRETP